MTTDWQRFASLRMDVDKVVRKLTRVAPLHVFFTLFSRERDVDAALNNTLSHFDSTGASRMVDVSEKPVTRREAVARGRVVMAPETMRLIVDRTLSKGDVLEVARLAAIMGAKRTGDLIPLCHPLPLESVSVDLAPVSESELEVSARCVVEAKTGVEMEALTAVAVACLTIYDMCKSVDRGMRIGSIELEEKSGGRSGTFRRS